MKMFYFREKLANFSPRNTGTTNLLVSVLHQNVKRTHA